MPQEKTYPYPSGDGEVKWVSTGWLADHLKDKNLQIIDSQPNIHDYLRGHIPGALYVEENHFRIAKERPGIFMPPEMAELLFRRLGIRRRSPGGGLLEFRPPLGLHHLHRRRPGADDACLHPGAVRPQEGPHP